MRSAAFAGHQTVGVVDGVDLLDRAQHRIEMAGVGELELEPHLGDPVAARVRTAGHDVDVLLADCVGDIARTRGILAKLRTVRAVLARYTARSQN